MTWVTHIQQGLGRSNDWDVNRREDQVKRENKELPCIRGEPDSVFRWIFLYVSPWKAQTLNCSDAAPAEMCLNHVCAALANGFTDELMGLLYQIGGSSHRGFVFDVSRCPPGPSFCFPHVSETTFSPTMMFVSLHVQTVELVTLKPLTMLVGVDLPSSTLFFSLICSRNRIWPNTSKKK